MNSLLFSDIKNVVISLFEPDPNSYNNNSTMINFLEIIKIFLTSVALLILCILIIIFYLVPLIKRTVKNN